MTDAPVIHMRDVRKRYGANEILRGIDLTVHRGEFVAIKGESGCGKTTLLRILGLVDEHFEGHYRLGDHIIRGDSERAMRTFQEEIRARDIGFIFQDDRLFDHLTIRENLELPIRIHGVHQAARRGNLDQLSRTVFRPDELQSKKILDQQKKSLSGGQRQRAAVIRALTHDPLFILADEPTASLDKRLKHEVFQVLEQLAAEGRTIVVVSHDALFEKAHTLYELGSDGRLHLTNTCTVIMASGQEEAGATGEETVAAVEAGVGEADQDQAVDVVPAGMDPTTSKGGAAVAVAPAAVATVAQTSAGGGSGPVETEQKPAEGRPRPPLKSAGAAWFGLRPRTSTFLQLRLAFQDFYRNKLFTLLALISLIAGSFQLTILWSLQMGTGDYLDELIRKGSRLTRITIRVKDLEAEDRFPDRDGILAMDGVRDLVGRREGIYRVRDARGRVRKETLFGLKKDDPEFDQLLFTAGGPFTREDALEVIISERNVKRLFKGAGKELTDDFRASLLGKKLRFVTARPRPGIGLQDITEDESQWDFMPIELSIQGIVAQAESGRNFYFPRTTQLILERWRLDRTGDFEVPLDAARTSWTADGAALIEMVDFPFEERAHVYLNDVEKVIPATRELSSLGYEPRSRIFDYQWVIDTRLLANIFITGLVFLVLLVAGLVIAGNILTSIKLRQKELVLLKLLGMRDGDISLVYILNAALAGIAGTGLGFLMGSSGVDRVGHYLATNYPSADFARIFGDTWPVSGWIITAGMLLAVLAAMVPAYLAGRTDPVKGF